MWTKHSWDQIALTPSTRAPSTEAFTSHPCAASTDSNCDPLWQFLTTSRRHSQKIVLPWLKLYVTPVSETCLQGPRSPPPRPPALVCQNTDFCAMKKTRCWEEEENGTRVGCDLFTPPPRRKKHRHFGWRLVRFGVGFRHIIALAFPVEAAERARLTRAAF